MREQTGCWTADNILTWDRAVMVASLVAMLEIDLSRLLIFVIHERAFKTSTTYSSACMIFYLCRDAEVPIWKLNTLQVRPMWRHRGEGLELSCSC